MLDIAYTFPAADGHIEIRSLAGDHVGVIVFDHGYGSSEFVRGPLLDCLERAFHVMREGTHHPPSHEPGAPLRWHRFTRDDSHRATLPGGELRVVKHGGTCFLVHVRRDSCCVFGCGSKDELLEAARSSYSKFEAHHRPLSIVHRGRRYDLKLTFNSDDLAAVTADDGTRFSVRITGNETLHLDRLAGGERSCIKTFAHAFDDLPEFLWSDGIEPSPPQSSSTPPALGTVRPSAGSRPGGPLHPEVRAAALAMFKYLAMLGGAGKCVRLWCRTAFEGLADRGIRVQGRGEELRKQLRLHSGVDLPGGMRVFRYAMATCRKLGLLVSDGTLDVLPFDDLHDPASEFARAVVAVFGKRAPILPDNDVPSTDASDARAGAPTVTQDPPAEPAAAPASPTTPSSPAEPESSVGLYPEDTWPFQDDTLEAQEAEGANDPGSKNACDPGGPGGDYVNWFGYKTDIHDVISFTDTYCGHDLIKEPSKPVSEEFFVNLARSFISATSGSAGDSS